MRDRRLLAAGILLIVLLSTAALSLNAASPASAADKIDRGNPRTSVTGFLQACRRQDYDTASLYLDLRYLPDRSNIGKGAEVARKLEALLNSATHFTVLDLTQNREGSGASGQSSPHQRVATFNQNGENYTFDLERVVLEAGGPMVWIFSPETVATVLKLKPTTSSPWWVHYLPAFMTSVMMLETPLWKWLALILAASLLFSVSRWLDCLLLPCFRGIFRRVAPQVESAWSQALIRPVRVLLLVAVYRIAVAVVWPSAVARLFLGRALELIAMWAIAWALVQIVDKFLNRVESNMAARREFSGRSILRLGRRTASATIVIIAILMILSSWGYNTATLVAGLGVGGIAIALAAQQTIANIFGGVSVIGDRPVAIGDFGKFGDLIGTVEDIGMRSTRVRTLNRTLVSVPNSTFAGSNLENYSQRDKILFNPTFQIKRSTPDEQVWQLIESIHAALKNNRNVELVPTPVRLTALTAAAFSIEVFCYVLTPDIDQFYKVQGELLLAINDVLQTRQLELV